MSSRIEKNTMLLCLGLAILCLVQPGCVSAMERRQVTYVGIQTEARELAGKEYRKASAYLPERIREFSYDDYMQVSFRPDKALWMAEQLPFQAQFFHRGYLYPDPVFINEFTATHVQEIPYVPDFFRFGKLELEDYPRRGSGYAGWRLHAPINSETYYDEVIAFLGASYFRAVGKGQVYGLSARAVMVPFAPDEMEEFPSFTRFWLRKPQHGDRSFRCFALLDGPSVTGAYQFVITPGSPTIIEVEASLYPRRELPSIGLGGLTSMFYYGENTFPKPDDFRPEVHDSDGLLLEYGEADHCWRPLDVASAERLSYFDAKGLTAFALVQRDRDFGNYLDRESKYHRRPAVRMVLKDGFDSGQVILREIPPRQEYWDNIVCGYFPDRSLVPGREYRFSYRMEWGEFAPSAVLAHVRSTRHGKDIHDPKVETFLIEYAVPEGFDPEGLSLESTVSGNADLTGEWFNLYPADSKVRVYLQVSPKSEGPVELTTRMLVGEKPVSEEWMYQWSHYN